MDDDRELCVDGACIGVVGPDGRCKVCGTMAREGSPFRADVIVPRAATPVPEIEDDEEWDHRRLCSDGACNGVLGPDGRCKVCQRA